jgi:hypothetical protein
MIRAGSADDRRAITTVGIDPGLSSGGLAVSSSGIFPWGWCATSRKSGKVLHLYSLGAERQAYPNHPSMIAAISNEIDEYWISVDAVRIEAPTGGPSKPWMAPTWRAIGQCEGVFGRPATLIPHREWLAAWALSPRMGRLAIRERVLEIAESLIPGFSAWDAPIAAREGAAEALLIARMPSVL